MLTEKLQMRHIPALLRNRHSSQPFIIVDIMDRDSPDIPHVLPRACGRRPGGRCRPAKADPTCVDSRARRGLYDQFMQ